MIDEVSISWQVFFKPGLQETACRTTSRSKTWRWWFPKTPLEKGNNAAKQVSTKSCACAWCQTSRWRRFCRRERGQSSRVRQRGTWSDLWAFHHRLRSGSAQWKRNKPCTVTRSLGVTPLPQMRKLMTRKSSSKGSRQIWNHSIGPFCPGASTATVCKHIRLCLGLHFNHVKWQLLFVEIVSVGGSNHLRLQCLTSLQDRVNCAEPRCPREFHTLEWQWQRCTLTSSASSSLYGSSTSHSGF